MLGLRFSYNTAPYPNQRRENRVAVSMPHIFYVCRLDLKTRARDKLPMLLKVLYCLNVISTNSFMILTAAFDEVSASKCVFSLETEIEYDVIHSK